MPIRLAISEIVIEGVSRQISRIIPDAFPTGQRRRWIALSPDFFLQHLHSVIKQMNQVALANFLKTHIHRVFSKPPNLHEQVGEKLSGIFPE